MVSSQVITAFVHERNTNVTHKAVLPDSDPSSEVPGPFEELVD